MRLRRPFAVVALVVALGLGCRQDMHDQPKYKPFRGSEFFSDGRAMRPLVEGTVARGTFHDGEPLHTGMLDGDLVTEIPLPLTAELLERGRREYQVFCSPCHGLTGRGDGVIVQPGSYSVKVSAKGYFSVDQEFSVVEGQVRVVEIKLREMPAMVSVN